MGGKVGFRKVDQDLWRVGPRFVHRLFQADITAGTTKSGGDRFVYGRANVDVPLSSHTTVGWSGIYRSINYQAHYGWQMADTYSSEEKGLPFENPRQRLPRPNPARPPRGGGGQPVHRASVRHARRRRAHADQLVRQRRPVRQLPVLAMIMSCASLTIASSFVEPSGVAGGGRGPRLARYRCRAPRVSISDRN
jgi:hypothetical protein